MYNRIITVDARQQVDYTLLVRGITLVSSGRHPDKDIQEVIDYAKEKGWTDEKGRGHGGRIKCPYNHPDGCQMSYPSSPKNSGNQKKRIIRFIDSCPHKGIRHEK